MEQYLWLIPVGLIVGAFGTLIGAGGGFILVPVLLLFYPQENPETITSITLAVVFFNSLSGSLIYARMKRIAYKPGLVFSAASIPGAILGALSTAYIPRRLFDAIFGVFMIIASSLMLVTPGKGKLPGLQTKNLGFASHSTALGIGLSTAVGYLSTLLGVGAGFIYVPVFVYLLDFPVHVATATSQFILALTAFTGTVTHILGGFFHHGMRRTIALSIGVILGAQIGAWFSQRIQGHWILRGLAVAMALVGIRIFLMAF
jgi:uncharacterized membrane protein YfcA